MRRRSGARAAAALEAAYYESAPLAFRHVGGFGGSGGLSGGSGGVGGGVGGGGSHTGAGTGAGAGAVPGGGVPTGSGSGPRPVAVLLHGFMGCKEDWASVEAHLLADARRRGAALPEVVSVRRPRLPLSHSGRARGGGEGAI